METIKFKRNIKRSNRIYTLKFDDFVKLLCSDKVRKITDYCRDENISDEKRYNKKRELPGIYFHIKTAVLTDKDIYGTPSEIVVLDIDHVRDVKNLYEKNIKPRIKELGIIFVQISVSGKGLHIGFRRNPKLTTIAANQLWMANKLGVKNFDKSVSDLGRTWFVTPIEEWLYLDLRAVNELLDVKYKTIKR